MNADKRGFFLSESGCTGFEDVQDVVNCLFVGGESCVCQNQDTQDLRMYRMGN